MTFFIEQGSHFLLEGFHGHMLSPDKYPGLVTFRKVVIIKDPVKKCWISDMLI